MAALGLSLDSDDGHLDSDTEVAQQNSVSFKNQIKSGRESVNDNEQQEYDVDGDSSRPVDSHSPSLNETSSLSSSGQRQRCGTNEKSALDKPCDEAKSALKDYFPLDSSFPPGTRGHASSEKPQRQRGKAGSKADGNLPKENMSHTEIVNRFLDNLTLEDTEHACGENDDLQTGQSGDKLPDDHSGSHDPQDVSMDVKCRADGKSKGNLTNISENMSVLGPTSSHVKSTGKQQNRLPGKDKDALEACPHPAQLFPISNSESQPQQWAPHPPLNHHHPLHSRHKHHQYYSNTTMPGMQDVNSNMYNILTSPNPVRPHSQNQPAIKLPYLGGLQQQYFYTDLHSPAPYAHIQPQYQSLPTEDNLAANLQHFYTANSEDQHATAQYVPNSVSPCTPSASSNKDTSQSVHCVSNWGASGDHLFGPSACQPPALPAVRMPVSLPLQLGQPPPLPALTHLPPHSAAASSPSVIIPGHISSQPISTPQVLNPTIESSVMDGSDGPRDLKDMLTQLGLLKYLTKFEEQDVDLQVFLSLTDNDLKELGIK